MLYLWPNLVEIYLRKAGGLDHVKYAAYYGTPSVFLIHREDQFL
jgi:hypothetical protein